jgi:hypothetical protein
VENVVLHTELLAGNLMVLGKSSIIIAIIIVLHIEWKQGMVITPVGKFL